MATLKGWNVARPSLPGYASSTSHAPANREAATGSCDHDASFCRCGTIDVMGMSTGLRDAAHVRKSLEQLAREASPLAIGHERVEPSQDGGITERGCENPDLRVVAKADTGRAVVRVTDIVENGILHGLPPHSVSRISAADSTWTAHAARLEAPRTRRGQRYGKSSCRQRRHGDPFRPAHRCSC